MIKNYFKCDEGSVLYKICTDKLSHVEKKSQLILQSELLGQVQTDDIRNFTASINNKINEIGTGIIAEVKKASPSKGVIREDFNHKSIARSYKRAGAACISVLTDEKYFQGKDEYIADIKERVKLPVLRKDFILTEYQVIESRCLGADCILLIMANLTDEGAMVLEKTAHDLGMQVLVEVHNQEELDRALNLNTRLLGINNRNLKTLEVDSNNTINLVKNNKLDDYLIVCESGIKTKADINKVKKIGVNSFLIGESLMQQDDVEEALKKLL